MKHYQIEHLLLLVGSNPLPNAVAGILLTMPESAITLIHSEATSDVALRLKKWLESKACQVRCLREVDESDPSSIFSGVQTELNKSDSTKIGLNYTGGTKAMAVHAYRAIEKWAHEKRNEGLDIVTTFSYLNPRRLEMVIDPNYPETGENSRRIPAGLNPIMTLKDLLDLHGWSLKHDPISEPTLPDTANVLAKVCAEKESIENWKEWVRGNLRAKCRDDKDKWYGKTKLPEKLELPSDPVIARTMQNELSSFGDDLILKQSVFNYDAKHFCEWLDGKWLEHHVLNEMRLLSQSHDLHQLLQNVETDEVQFDLDVVALRGYQLFAISCSTDTTKSLLKSKLFEAYIRARQLGGDEARIALICCSDRPEQIEHEMRRDVDSEGRIRVFGQPHLSDLKASLATWIDEQIKGVRGALCNL